MQIETVLYNGWPNCRRISNGTIELIATTDVGPRIIRFGFVGGENEFREVPEHAGLTGGSDWRSYGGHRLWHAPENQPRTYQPDNETVLVESLPDSLRLVQPVEALTGIRKEMDIQLTGDNTVRVIHRLCNTALFDVELAPWALSVMAPGGVAVFPLPERGVHPQDLLPSSTITVWPYTDLSDPRWIFGRQFVLLRQDTTSPTPQKFGGEVSVGWCAYARQGHLFVKRFSFQPGVTYPDRGCNVEIFTNTNMLELETLGPLVKVKPGAVVEYVEDWYLLRDVPVPQSEAAVLAHILPRVVTLGG
jgi:hypothetical protein